jgi:hypothetical protein
MSFQDSMQQTNMLLAETEPWVQPLYSVLDPFFNLFSFAMVSFKNGNSCMHRTLELYLF